jgi:hypothetical protein
LSASAQEDGEIIGPTGDLPGFFTNVTGLVRFGVLFTFLGVSIYGGILRMTAAGNAEQEEKSSKTLIGGIVGFIITALAPVFVSLVQQIIGVK